ncbi:hypothetical protein QBC35DRAFT_471972 [Podospora australis]|uniref:Uncharacterized protein n=1 Tax=Podospora australis TaxID=1536484 RepID=A0AAN6WXT5_9PEZI|nr:hypothetical protein QBC35DRAFT_471972 [Podospora australis]
MGCEKLSTQYTPRRFLHLDPSLSSRKQKTSSGRRACRKSHLPVPWLTKISIYRLAMRWAIVFLAVPSIPHDLSGHGVSRRSRRSAGSSVGVAFTSNGGQLLDGNGWRANRRSMNAGTSNNNASNAREGRQPAGTLRGGKFMRTPEYQKQLLMVNDPFGKPVWFISSPLSLPERLSARPPPPPNPHVTMGIKDADNDEARRRPASGRNRRWVTDDKR